MRRMLQKRLGEVLREDHTKKNFILRRGQRSLSRNIRNKNKYCSKLHKKEREAYFDKVNPKKYLITKVFGKYKTLILRKSKNSE